MDGPIDVIRFKQQQEDPKFLSHFGGKFIIHWVRKCIDDLYLSMRRHVLMTFTKYFHIVLNYIVDVCVCVYTYIPSVLISIALLS